MVSKSLSCRLCIDGLLVSDRIYGSTALAHYVVVVEAADDMNDGIALADVSEKLIAEAFTFGSTFHQSGDVHDLTGGGHDASRVHDFGKA